MSKKQRKMNKKARKEKMGRPVKKERRKMRKSKIRRG
jgi:hypothetical protein